MNELLDDEILDDQREAPFGKVFTEGNIIIGVLLGGPLTATYMMSKNFYQFNNKDKGAATWIVGILYTVGLFLMSSHLLVTMRLPTLLYSILNTTFCWIFFNIYQKQMVFDHLFAGGEKQSKWHVFAVIVIAFATVMLLSMTFFFLIDLANTLP